MCDFKERVQKAKSLVQFIGVTQRKDGKAKVLSVPGSNDAKYRVILRRNGKFISAECAKDLNKLGYKTCEGNVCTKTLCYHSIAAIEFSIREAGFKSHWCETQENAQRLHKMLGGVIYQANSFDGNGKCFILIDKEK